jgi:NRAMP (natural resistance-associated macrophage protein)-like metal ion transporter
MKNILKNTKTRLLVFLAVLGPSTITTMAGNDGAGVITYSLAGARIGYSILFILPFLTLLYAVTQEMGSRVAIVTGRGLADLIRERFGIKTSIFVFSLLLLANFGTVLTNVAALKTAATLLHLPTFPFIMVLIVGSILLVTLTNYEKSQKLFLTGILVYLTYVFSAFKGNPDWALASRSLIMPPSHLFQRDYLVMAIAVLGTTITPWGQFFVQSYMKDKNLSIEQVPFAKIEAYFGSILSNLFTFFIIVATAATLFVHSIPLNSGEQAALAIKPFAGNLSSLLFSIGLVNAAVIGMIIVSLSSAYVFSEFFGFEGSLDAPYDRGKIFYGIFILSLVLAAVIVSLPQVSLFHIVFYTQSLNAILLPLILFFLLKIMNNRELMGKFVNSKFDNGIAIFASILIIVASFAAVLMTIFR